MSDSDHLPDDALVVRGGIVNGEILRAKCDDYEGYYGFSVQSFPDKTFQELASKKPLRNRHVGVTTVGQIRAVGFDVIPTPGAGFHATVVVPPSWTIADAEILATVFTDRLNPAWKK